MARAGDTSGTSGRTWGDQLVDTLIRQGRLPPDVRQRNRPGQPLDVLKPLCSATAPRSDVASFAPSNEVGKQEPSVAVVEGGLLQPPATASSPPSSGPKPNKTESRWLQRLAAEGHSPRFNAITLIIESPVKRRRYTPDVLIAPPTGLELHEVKGFWQDDARVKIKVAAEMAGMRQDFRNNEVIPVGVRGDS